MKRMLLSLGSLFFLAFRLHAQQFDLAILNGKIVDGSGNSWFYGDVALKEGKIAKIGKAKDWDSKNVIDAKGMIVAPGFIDVHTHVEGSDIKIFGNGFGGVLELPTAGNFIMDGVTSVVTGNCGG